MPCEHQPEFIPEALAIVTNQHSHGRAYRDTAPRFSLSAQTRMKRFAKPGQLGNEKLPNRVSALAVFKGFGASGYGNP